MLKSSSKTYPLFLDQRVKCWWNRQQEGAKLKIGKIINENNKTVCHINTMKPNKISPELVGFYQIWADLRRSRQIWPDLWRSAQISEDLLRSLKICSDLWRSVQILKSAEICRDLINIPWQNFLIIFEFMLTFFLRLERYAPHDGPTKECLIPMEMFICERAQRECQSFPLVLRKK